MDSAKSQLLDRLKSANTILVTVSKNPSVDQLAACIGLTLIINKLNKHGSAVYSGKTPSTIEFLKPEDTIEKTTDSLRDFIIALDKEKADKLRYKVEDQTVRIFITPYRTSLDQSDLEFSQGDFNVELIIALGVNSQEDLDQAITAHGRILHDATVASITIGSDSNLGSINWADPQASSLCEIVADTTKLLGDNLLDEQIATALLTGIVSETERFSNEKTSSLTMSTSSELMAAGANQQLVATELEDEEDLILAEEPEEKSNDSDSAGTLNIEHEEQTEPSEQSEPPKVTETEEDEQPEVSLPEPTPIIEEPEEETSSMTEGDLKFVTDPPQLGGTLTANTEPEVDEPITNPLTESPTDQQPSTNEPASPAFTPPPPTWSASMNGVNQLSEPDVAKTDEATLTELEKSVNSPHLLEAQSETVDNVNSVESARDQVDAVLAQSVQSNLKPTESLNAMPLGDPLRQLDNTEVAQNNLPPIEASASDQLPPPVPPPIPVPPYSYDNPTDNPPAVPPTNS
jgi:hypothetical protein